MWLGRFDGIRMAEGVDSQFCFGRIVEAVDTLTALEIGKTDAEVIRHTSVVRRLPTTTMLSIALRFANFPCPVPTSSGYRARSIMIRKTASGEAAVTHCMQAVLAVVGGEGIRAVTPATMTTAAAATVVDGVL